MYHIIGTGTIESHIGANTTDRTYDQKLGAALAASGYLEQISYRGKLLSFFFKNRDSGIVVSFQCNPRENSYDEICKLINIAQAKFSERMDALKQLEEQMSIIAEARKVNTGKPGEVT